MKKIILIFSFGMCIHFIYAQQFDSLTDTNKLWSVVDDYNGSSPPKNKLKAFKIRAYTNFGVKYVGKI